MKIRMALCRAGAVALALFVAGTSAAAKDKDETGKKEKASGKAIPYTTQSKEARQYAEEVIRRVESYQFGSETNAVAQKAVAADPNFAWGHYLVAATSDGPEAARPHHEKALELAKNASDGERRYIEAMALLRAQPPQFEQSLAAFNELARDYPDDRKVQMMIAILSLNRGKLDDARAALERANKIDASMPRAHALLGNYYLLKGEYPTAREHYKKSLALKAPGSVPFQGNFGLAYTYVYEGDLQSALKVLNAFREEYTKTQPIPDLPPVFLWNSIGRLYLENGQPEEAIKHYEKGYETVPGSKASDEDKMVWLGRLHHGRGRALAKMGKHDEAWKEAETIKKMIDDAGERGKEYLPAYHYIAGYLKLEAGDAKAAIEHLTQANQQDLFHKLLLARAYEKAGDEAASQKVYKEIVDSTQVSIERALAYPEAKKKLKG
jgi:tetratricopeptide (TPR) repeat protein